MVVRRKSSGVHMSQICTVILCTKNKFLSTLVNETHQLQCIMKCGEKSQLWDITMVSQLHRRHLRFSNKNRRVILHSAEVIRTKNQPVCFDLVN